MPDPLIRYDLLAQEALRGVVRTVLADVAKKGLPGEHHFKITFNTAAPGVRLSDRLRAQYPDTMTIILQHQFWDLDVSERGFEVGLSFGGISERLVVPFDSIIAFYDPAVQFGFQFEAFEAEAAAGETGEAAKIAPARGERVAEKSAPPALPAGKSAAGKKPQPGAASAKVAEKAGEKAAEKAGEKSPEPPVGGDDKPDGGGEVVRLDRFRKK